mmetsp:Transcript_5057/g.11034  ORF Transcript_5057/g.11034 Transcript_5057/m.11034 type:complete len:244 (+) Transcript_5057:657-1388(+)
MTSTLPCLLPHSSLSKWGGRQEKGGVEKGEEYACSFPSSPRPSLVHPFPSLPHPHSRLPFAVEEGGREGVEGGRMMRYASYLLRFASYSTPQRDDGRAEGGEVGWTGQDCGLFFSPPPTATAGRPAPPRFSPPFKRGGAGGASRSPSPSPGGCMRGRGREGGGLRTAAELLPVLYFIIRSCMRCRPSAEEERGAFLAASSPSSPSFLLLSSSSSSSAGMITATLSVSASNFAALLFVVRTAKK